MDSCQFRVEFTVAGDIDLEEQQPNPVLESLRSALGADERVTLMGIDAVVRVGDKPRQQLLVWVAVFSNSHDDGLRSALEAVSEVVGRVIPSASYSGFDEVD